MNWKEVIIEINKEAAEASANILNEFGAGGVVFDSKKDKEILKAYFYDDQDFPDLMENIKEKINKLKDFGLARGVVLYTINETRHEDWANSWHEYFKAIKVGNNFIISPSWEKAIDTDRMLIEIDPGMAFGIGSHETTQMCIELLEKYIQANDTIDNMLDIGTGTGILSIVAAYLGIDDITGIDIDPAAVSAAQKNIEINQVQNKVKIIKGDLGKDITGVYSIITANLLPNLIMDLLPSIPVLMDKNSILILSGIIREKRDMIIKKMDSLKLKSIEETYNNEWLSIVAVKKR
ncbi:MAG: 50S ribosomal protein L11 methyltransferase [Bacillota bacterium]